MSKIYRYIVAGGITAVVLFLVWYFSNVVAYILTAAVLAMICSADCTSARRGGCAFPAGWPPCARCS